MIKGKKISIIVPAKNESGGIEKVLKAVMSYGDEVLLIDGHSIDNTVEIAKTIGVTVVLDSGKGKGAGIRTGLENATGDIVVLIDSDGSHEPHDIPKLLTPILEDEADLVIGSRVKGGSDESYMSLDHLVRTIGCALITFIINHRWKTNLTDIENGFKAIKTDVALSLGLKANRFEIEQEIVINCLKNRYKIVEVASHEYARGWGKSKLPTIHGLRFLWNLFVNIW